MTETTEAPKVEPVAPKKAKAKKAAAPKRALPAADAPGKWPAWYDGPDGEAKIFSGPDEVPAGWTGR